MNLYTTFLLLGDESRDLYISRALSPAMGPRVSTYMKNSNKKNKVKPKYVGPVIGIRKTYILVYIYTFFICIYCILYIIYYILYIVYYILYIIYYISYIFLLYIVYYILYIIYYILYIASIYNYSRGPIFWCFCRSATTKPHGHDEMAQATWRHEYWG